jgi:hypothetical protein
MTKYKRLTKSKLRKFHSMNDLYRECMKGNQAAQRLCIGALENLGQEAMAGRHKGSKWLRAWHGLQDVITSLVGEYSMSEDEAEQTTMDEINFVRDICDDIQL